MKKKVKKIPKYSQGIPRVEASSPQEAFAKFSAKYTPDVASGGSGFGGWGGAIGAAGTSAGKMVMNIAGVEDNSQLGVTLNSSMKGAEIGGTFVPGWGHLFGGIAGAALGSFKKGSVDDTTGDIEYGGIFGRSKDGLIAEQNRVRNTIANRRLTQDLNQKFASDPSNNMNTNIYATVAEGGIMRQPVDALISKGELIYNPVTKKLSKVPGSKGKPNKADNVYARLSEGDVVISNSPTMLMANGKTPAQNLEGLVDSNKNQKAKEAIIKKVVNWQEANKTKSKEFKKYSKGTPYVQLGEDPIKKLESNLFKPQTPEIKGKDRRWMYHLSKAADNLSDYAPLMTALFKDYDYHTEQSYINPAKYISTGVSIDPIRRAADESYAMTRYNQSNLNPNTGAGMMYGLQAAKNRTKSLADAYQWQQEQQNKLIAQNIGISNDWASKEAQARHIANTETRQNEGAEQQMRDSAIRDAYEFMSGRRNDRWKLSMLEPMFRYAVDDKIWKKFKV